MKDPRAVLKEGFSEKLSAVFGIFLNGNMKIPIWAIYNDQPTRRLVTPNGGEK